MDHLRELYLLIAAVIAFACGMAVVLAVLAPDVHGAWRRFLARHQQRRRARIAIRCLAIQTERYARMARDAAGRGELTKARVFRIAAGGCADRALVLARGTFATGATA